MRAGSIGTLGCALAFFLRVSAGVDAAFSNDLSSKVSKRQSIYNNEISRDGISTETAESEATTSSPEASKRNINEYLRSGAYAIASSDGSSQAVAQATATNGGENKLNPGMEGNPQYPQYPQSNSLGYDLFGFGNYNPHALTPAHTLGNPQAQQNTQPGITPYSLPSFNWNAKYPGASPNIYPNRGYNFAPQQSDTQTQAQSQANILQQAYPNYPTSPSQNYPWDTVYNNIGSGYGFAQPQAVAGSPSPASSQTLGQGYYPYGQTYSPQPVPYNYVYPGSVSGYPDLGSAQSYTNSLGARRSSASIPALAHEEADFDKRRFATVPYVAQHNFGAQSDFLAYPRSAQNSRPNMQSFGPAYLNAGYNSGSLEAQSDIPVYKFQSSLLPETFGFTTSPANSRIVPEDELLYPHKIPGAENSIVCSRQGELHYLWTVPHQCLVCMCASDRGQLRPICARCAGCHTADSAQTEPTQTISPLTLDQLSPSEIPASCNPLPTNKEFQNPLNPCQVCICRQTNRRDVKITCEESPQCVIPSNVPTIPPMSVPSKPVSLPLCNKMPQNVFFPHPTDACKLCKCIVERSPLGAPEPRVLCQPNPDCGLFPAHPDQPPRPSEPYPFPTDEVVPQDPNKPETLPYVVTGYPASSEAYLSPETVTEHNALSTLTIPSTPPSFLEPAPWPPSKRGPLPGPPPHESCRPFPPNTPFDHPWDECQVCVCSEASVQNRVSVEVSCYTKPSCCIENPMLGPTKQVRIPTSIPAAASGTSSKLHILDKMCEFKSFGVEFRSEADRCRICSCDLIGAYVVPVCRRASLPECINRPASIFNGQVIYIEPRCRQQLPYQPFAVGCNQCTCQSIFNYVVAKCTANPLCQRADLEEKTLANAQTNAQSPFLSYSGSLVSAPLQHTRPVPYSPQAIASGYANTNSYQKGPATYSSNPASAQANALSQNSNFYRNALGGYKGYPSQADAEALAMATASSSGLYTPSIINSYPNRNIYSLENSVNRADSLAQTQNSIYSPSSNSYLYTPLNTAQTSAMQVLPTSDVYPSTYSRPGYNLTPINMGSSWDTSKARTISNAQSSNAMASASAIAGGSEDNADSFAN